MTRRGVSRLLISLGLLVGTLAWTGLTLQRTIFDATRSERVVGVLLENDQVQGVLRQQLVRAIDAALPEELRAQVPTAELAGAAAAALDDPRVQTAVRQALVDSHRYVIGEMDQPPLLDTTVIDSALREQVGNVSPALAGLLPHLGPVRIELPSAGLSPIAKARDLAIALTPLLAFTALCLVAAGILFSPDKPRALRRVGFWGVSLGAVWVVLRFFLPALAERLLGDSGIIVAALTESVASGMALPGVVLFGGGLTVLLLASLVAAMQRDLSAAARRAQRERDLARQQARQEARQLSREAKAARVGSGRRPAPAGPTGTETRRQPAVGNPGNEAAVWSPSTPAADAGLYSPPKHAQAPVDHRTVNQPAAWHPGSPPSQSPTPSAGAGPDAGFAPASAPTVSPHAATLAIPLPKRQRREVQHDESNPAHTRPAPNEWLGGFSMQPGDHAPIAEPAPAPPRWVEGVGYVFEQSPDPSARWVDGLGYVMDQD